MNSDEYHNINRDENSPNYMSCNFCGRIETDHEQACPYHPDTDNLVYQQLREPWTDTP